MKPIPSFPDYFCDEIGNIYSMRKVGRGHGLLDKPKLLYPSIRKCGRKHVVLRKNGENQSPSIATLLLETFVSPRPQGMLACHGIRGCKDDSFDNIYWGTQSRNLGEDRRRDKTMPEGEKSCFHKLNELQVRIIIQFCWITNDERGSFAYLAKIFNCTPENVSFIARNKTWKYLPRHN